MELEVSDRLWKYLTVSVRRGRRRVSESERGRVFGVLTLLPVIELGNFRLKSFCAVLKPSDPYT